MIEVKHLSRRYGDHMAVNDLSFSVENGQIYGFLGPNGAGKSTTMNMITGCLAPTGGQVLIGGYDIFTQPEEAKKLIGYLPELPPLYPDMTPREYLSFVAAAKRIPDKQIRSEVDRVLEQTQVTELGNRLIKNLSKGYRQRVGLAQAILGDPKLVILDEPSVGLDPKQITEMRQLILELGKTRTVILSSHIMQEISAVCDHLLIISGGRKIADGTPAEISDGLVHENRLEVTVVCSPDPEAVLGSIEGVTALNVVPSVRDSGAFDITIDGSADKDLRQDVFRAICAAGGIILRMEKNEATLEDIFLKLTSIQNDEKGGVR